MSLCPDATRLQEYLDGELAAPEAAAVRAHSAACVSCRRDLVRYRVLFDRLAVVPLLDPGPAFTERVLAEVLPSRVRLRRRLATLGWTYASLVVATVAALFALALQPAPRRLFESISGAASRTVVETGVFVLNIFTGTALRLADGWGWLASLGERIAPLGRALETLVRQPALLATVWAAAIACALLLWWMRPRRRPADGGRHRVVVLGF